MKKTIFVILIFACSLLQGCGKSSTSGTVTFLVNETVGFMPDSGATVYATQLSAEPIEKFVEAAAYKFNIEVYRKQIKMCEYSIELEEKAMKDPFLKDTMPLHEQIETYKKAISQYTDVVIQLQQALYNLVRDEEEYELWEKNAVNNLVEIKADPTTVSTTTNGNGGYTLTLPKGEYYLIFISRNSLKLNLLEKQGAVRVKKISLPDYITLDVRFNPSLPE